MSKFRRHVVGGFRKRFNTQNPFEQSPFNKAFDKSRSVPPPGLILRKTRDDDIRITRAGDKRKVRF